LKVEKSALELSQERDAPKNAGDAKEDNIGGIEEGP
jgi:hypothetical protein